MKIGSSIFVRNLTPWSYKPIINSSSRSLYFQARVNRTLSRKKLSFNFKSSKAKVIFLAATGLTFSFLLSTNKAAQAQESSKVEWNLLSLDGGGIRGILTLMILKELEYRLEKPVIDIFDFFAGTSTGGIIALGLTKAQPYVQASTFYEKLHDKGMTEAESHELFHYLIEKEVLWRGGETPKRVGELKGDKTKQEGDIRQIDLTSLTLPDKFSKYKKDIIEILQTTSLYRKKETQFTTDDLLQLYTTKGKEIFSVPKSEHRSYSEQIFMRLLEIFTVPALLKLAKEIYKTSFFKNALTWGESLLDYGDRLLNWLPVIISTPVQGIGWVLATISIIGGLYVICTHVWSALQDSSFWPKIIFDLLLSFGIETNGFGPTGDMDLEIVLNVVFSFLWVTFNHLKLQHKLHDYIFGPKFSAESLEKLLLSYFGETRMKDAVKPVLVTTFDTFTNLPKEFKEFHLPGVASDSSSLKMRYAARATSAAPTYFEPLTLCTGRYIDGGVYANNPALISKKLFKQHYPFYKLNYLLSVGTGHTASKRNQEMFSSGAIYEIQDLVNVLMSTAEIEEALQSKLIGRSYERIQIELDEVIDLSDASEQTINKLQEVAKKYIKEGGNQRLHNVCRNIDQHYYATHAKKFFWEKGSDKEPSVSNTKSPSPSP